MKESRQLKLTRETMTAPTTTLWTLDQLLRQRAIDDDQTPLLAFPKKLTSATDFEHITGAALNRFVDGAAKSFMLKGIPATASIYPNDCSWIGLSFPFTI